MTTRDIKIYLLVLFLIGCDTSEPDVRATPIQTIDVSPAITKMAAHPSELQLKWQKGEMYMFVHFGMNTFTGDEWGDGTPNPDVFNPSALDPNQWASVAKEIGFDGVIFTTKHHDGFALWPTATSDYSVSNSSWRQGSGDVVKEVADAVRSHGLRFGVYVSPWDRHEPSWGTPAYNDIYVAQIEELLTNYGEVFEIWFDGAQGDLIDPQYDYSRHYSTVRSSQPNTLIFGGPDLRWIGNETGTGNETEWPETEPGRWFPAECDVPNRPGWFWRESEDNLVKPASKLLDIYFTSVGRNCTLLLNVPPDNRGLFHENDIAELRAFRSLLDTIFGQNSILLGEAFASSRKGQGIGWVAQNAIDGKSETFWVAGNNAEDEILSIEFDEHVTFNVLRLEEPIEFGQRVAKFRVETIHDPSGEWIEIATGTTIGYRRLFRVPQTRTLGVRLVVEESLAPVAISEMGLHWIPQ